jgi:hypothetical protein
MASTTTYASQASRGVADAVRALQGDRILGIVGAVTTLVATALSWYQRDLTIQIGDQVTHFTSGITLWQVRNLAEWLLIAGAGIGIAGLVLPAVEERRGGLVAGIAGFGIAFYSLVAMFDLPDFASGTFVSPHAAARVAASVDAGSFVALVGGIFLLIGGLTASRDSQAAAFR